MSRNLSEPFPGADALGPFKSIYLALLDAVNETFGLDPSVILNLTLILAAVGTFMHYASGHIYRYAQKICLSNIHINDDDQLYAQTMRWMTDNQLSTHKFRSVKATTPQKSSWEDEEDATKTIGQSFDPDRLISYRSIIGRLPIRLQPFEGSHIFRHRGSWIMFRHRVHKGSALLMDPREKGSLDLECFGRSLAAIERLLEDIQTYNLERSMSTTTVFRAITSMREMIRWTKVVERPSRDIRTVILTREKKQALLQDVNEYLHPKTRRWYANHGVPYRRGYLFSGAPGTGKTSLTSALAGVFGLDIYVLSLLDPAMNESQLMRLLSEVPSRCIVLLEDVDAAGLGKRANTSGMANRQKAGQTQELLNELTSAESKLTASGISLSGLLNAIDGVSSHEGRILVMTTNTPDALDKALTRPGRVDMHIHFELPSHAEIEELFLSMYTDDLNKAPQSSETPDKSSMANGNVKANSSKHIAPSEDKILSDLRIASDEKTQEQARQFAKAIPEGMLSLAAIQGFMLGYKSNPEEACNRVNTWAAERVKEIEAEKEGG